MESEESKALIASDRVEGAIVYNLKGEKLGSIHNFMIDKESGQVAYAVLKARGFLGLGAEFYSVPWTALVYDENRHGYVIDADKDALEKAPRSSPDGTPCFVPARGQEIYVHYMIEYEEE